ncbi:TerD family protein [Vibrio splendidus]
MDQPISLSKNQSISLTKSKPDLVDVVVGVNWGARTVESKGIFGLGAGKKKEAVDLDIALGFFDKQFNTVLDHVYYRDRFRDGVALSEDDTQGDLDGDDGLDNETCVLNLKEIDSRVEFIPIVVNIFSRIPFEDVPYANVRVYEGTPDRVDNVFATANLSGGQQFVGKRSVVLGYLARKDGLWNFTALITPTDDTSFAASINSAIQMIRSAV